MRLTFSLPHRTTRETVSGWIFLLLVFPHLFTSASLKGMVTTTPQGRCFRTTLVDIFRLYSPASPSQALGNSPGQSPLLTMLQPYLLRALNMSNSLTSWGLVYRCSFCLQSARHQLKCHLLLKAFSDCPSASGKSCSHHPVVCPF